jgi:hypothetical protein
MQSFKETDSEEKAFPCKVVHRKWDPENKTFYHIAELLEKRQNIEETTCDVI